MSTIDTEFAKQRTIRVRPTPAPETGAPSARTDDRALVTTRFIRQLLPPKEADEVLRGFYTEPLRAALTDLLAELRDASEPKCRTAVRPLAKWRLRRVYDFVDAHIEERISLPRLAGIAGISRMYFAAQFRAATGLRPHDYIMRRRIALAKAMLSSSVCSIVDIALQVGFQTQPHFTTAFKRTEGMTPHKWRELSREIAVAA